MTIGRHIGLRVKDVARSRRFYEEGLGLRFLAQLNIDGTFALSDGHINVTFLPYTGPERRPFAEGTEFIHLGFVVDDLQATYDRLLRLGGMIARDDIKARREHDPNQRPERSFKVLDPDGNVLDITDRPDEWLIG